MQKLETIKKPDQTMTSSKVGKKSKGATKSKNTTKNNLQFTEILGQLSLSLPPIKAAITKQTETAQSKTVVSTAKSAKAMAEGVRNIGQSAESARGKTELGNTAKVPNKPVKMLAKTIVAESKEEATAHTDIDLASRSKSEIKSNASIMGSKVRGMEKSAVASTIGETHSPVTSTNMGNASKGDIRAIANIMGSQGSGREKSVMASTIGEKHSAATSNTSKSMAPSEFKIADLMLANNIDQAGNPSSRAKEMPPKQEVSASSISSSRTGSDIAVKSKEHTKNGDKEAGSEAARSKTPGTKTEIVNNSRVGENGVVEFEVGESGVVNVEKTMLTKSQADLLVSKMIQQIKVAPSSLEVSLKPEYLGKINILVQSIAGVISVNVIAQNSEALNLVNSNLQNIKDNLEQQGINVQQLEVNLSNQEKHNNPHGNRFTGESPVAKLVEKANSLTEYGDLVEAEQGSSLLYKLNLLA